MNWMITSAIALSLLLLGLPIYLQWQARRQLRESDQRWLLALEGNRDGVWDWNMATNEVFFSTRWKEMLGYADAEIGNSLDEWDKRIHPDDKEQTLVDVNRHFAGETPYYENEHRVLCKDGSYKWILDRGKIISWTKDNEPLQMIGTHTDISQRRVMETKLIESEHKFRSLVEAAQILPWKYNLKEGRFTFVGAQIEAMLGFTTDTWTDLESWSNSIHPDDRHPSITYCSLSTEAGEDHDFEYRCISASGKIVWIRDIVTLLKDKHGKPYELVGFMLDITDRKQAEESQRLAASVFVHSQDGIIVTDARNRIIDANPASFKLTGYSREEMRGENPRLFSSGNQPPKFYTSMWKTLAEQGHWQGEIQNRKKSGELYTERLSVDAVHDQSGKLQHYVGVFSDITYLKEHAFELERIAFNDSLTGLPNRRLLQDRMAQALIQAKRHNTLVAICYLDLDSFKPINDIHGHQTGDQILIEVARRLQHKLRNSDTVARLGGDEFILLIPDFQEIAELEQLLDRILECIAKPYPLNGTKMTLSATIGIAIYPKDHTEADTLLRHADQAMYTAKRAGKNRYHFFDSSEEQRSMANSSIQREIETALDEQQLRLYYQPKVNMRSGLVVGVEALVRWQHPKKGLLAPDSFLPTIEHSELIIDLGRWVLRQALAQIRTWKAEGIELDVSVNIAALQLQQTNFISSLKSLLDEFPDISSSRLELEILETAALHDIDHVSKTITECAALGVQFSLDDFGTGYSSLTYLKRLPAQVLKIDRSFIRNLLDDAEDLAITKGILGLAKAFNRTPVAEGVETVEHGTLLLELGCELTQGYGIARPMPAHDLAAWLESYQIPSEWKKTVPDYMI